MAENASLSLRSTVYRTYEGEHPYFAEAALFNLSNELKADKIKALQGLTLPVTSFGNGHTTLEVTLADGTTQTSPLTPLLVKDLAGRVVYTGAKCEEKTPEDWAAEDTQRNRFPNGCMDITAEMPGAATIENTFLTEIRTLTPHLLQNQNVEAFPYTERLDTFYADGWRLPQTQMLYVRTHVDVQHANHLGQKLLTRWAEKSARQTYTEFYEAVGGETYFEKLFLQGCTLIPTLEACNGYNKVNAQFELEDFHAGRAVQGLHTIVGEQTSDTPQGTIVEVKAPGFITTNQIIPAQVVVSNGVNYQTPFAAKAPLQPDLRLPHLRCSNVWGAVWLPVSPGHFAPPALWAWGVQTGAFMQNSGPLWSPLHYVYGSTHLVQKACKANNLTVPDAMKRRFYPISNLQYKGEQLADAGYHPLPLAAEWELNPYLFPDRAPAARGITLPADMPENKLIKCITPKKLAMDDAANRNIYAFLARYLNPNAKMLPADQKHIHSQLPAITAAELTRHIRRAMGGVKRRKALDAVNPKLFEALKNFREQALWWRRLQYRLAEKYPAEYTAGYWQMEEPELTEKALRYQNVGRKLKAETAPKHTKKGATATPSGVAA